MKYENLLNLFYGPSYFRKFYKNNITLMIKYKLILNIDKYNNYYLIKN